MTGQFFPVPSAYVKERSVVVPFLGECSFSDSGPCPSAQCSLAVYFGSPVQTPLREAEHLSLLSIQLVEPPMTFQELQTSDHQGRIPLCRDFTSKGGDLFLSCDRQGATCNKQSGEGSNAHHYSGESRHVSDWYRVLFVEKPRTATPEKNRHSRGLKGKEASRWPSQC